MTMGEERQRAIFRRRRVVAAALSDSYGQVIVEDKPGASGLIAAGAVAEAIPNGRTVLLGSNSTLVNNLAMMSTLPYDAKSFVPVAFVGYQPQVILVRGDLPYKSLADLVADAKAHPGKLNYATGLGGLQLARVGLVIDEASPGVPRVGRIAAEQVASLLLTSALAMARGD